MAENTNYYQVLDLAGVQQLWNTCKETFVRTVNGNGIDANGNVQINVAGDFQVNGSSVVVNGVANINTQSAYNASTNKIATMADVDKTINVYIGTPTYMNGNSKDIGREWFNAIVLINDSVVGSESIGSSGLKTITFTTPSSISSFTLKHDGLSYDITIFTTSTRFLKPNTTYTMSFNVNGYNPTLTDGLQLSNIMINEGSTALPYHEAKAVLLWENATPNSAYSATTISNLSLSNFKYIIIGYKTNSGSEVSIMYKKVKIETGKYFQIVESITASNNIYSREYQFVSNGIRVLGGYYNNGSSYDNSIIPVEIYGTNNL